MFKNLFKFIDQPLAKVISNVKVRVSLYFVGLTLLIWFLNIIDFWSTMFGLEDYRSLEKFKDPITVLIQSAVFAATVLLFVVGAGVNRSKGCLSLARPNVSAAICSRHLAPVRRIFFLRLYVANEVDLKHNRNELTNLEVKMMALQLAISFGDASSKKEIVRVLSKTERNFVLKRNEKIISADNSTEYNDMKAVLEQVLRKIPTIKAS
jgi:hypothetical protein